MTPAEQRAREGVRMEAAARFEHGESTSRIARWLRVGQRQVRKWRQAWREGGVEALRSSGPQSAPLLSQEQFARLESELRKGPAAHGWDEDQRWTLARIVTVTDRAFGIRLSSTGFDGDCDHPLVTETGGLVC